MFLQFLLYTRIGFVIFAQDVNKVGDCEHPCVNMKFELEKCIKKSDIQVLLDVIGHQLWLLLPLNSCLLLSHSGAARTAENKIPHKHDAPLVS